MQSIKQGNPIALLPLVVFLGIYLAGSLLAGDFYKMPIVVAGMIASIVAVIMCRKMTLTESVDSYSRGATEPNIMLMIWIFVLAGAFAASTKSMGAVDATVALTLRIIPEEFLPAGVFLAACFTSFSVGTSVGTIVALTPIASAIAEQTGGRYFRATDRQKLKEIYDEINTLEKSEVEVTDLTIYHEQFVALLLMAIALLAAEMLIEKLVLKRIP